MTEYGLSKQVLSVEKKIFIETTIFIRYFTRDDEKKYFSCREVLKHVEKGGLSPYTSSTVIFEIVYVLVSLYKFPKTLVIEKLKEMLTMRNLTIIDKTDSKQAFSLFETYSIKYGDCLIATQVPKDALLITYDADFEKIPHLKVRTPDKVSL